MATRLHYQDSAAGATAPDDTQGEHEAVPASWGKHLLVVFFLKHVLMDPIYFDVLFAIPTCIFFNVI